MALASPLARMMAVSASIWAASWSELRLRGFLFLAIIFDSMAASSSGESARL